jgi:hypothetical protein
MGFRPEPTIYNLSFKGTELDGLHVRASACSVDEYGKMLAAAVSSESDCILCDGRGHIEDAVSGGEVKCQVCRGRGKVTGAITAQTLEDNEFILGLFANHLVSWDLEDLAGQPVPTTREGIGAQERRLISQLITAWQVALVRVPNPLKTESSGGEISEEQSLGLDSASKNLES